MDDMERLAAIEEIRILKARYFRAIDTKDRELFRTLFTADAVVDARGSATDPVSGINSSPTATSEILEGIDTIVDVIMTAIETKVSVHQGCMPEIEIISDTTASAIWAMSDRLRFADGPIAELIGFGHYHENYHRTDGMWKISRLRLTRLRVDVVPTIALAD
jgi:hypothetical protein